MLCGGNRGVRAPVRLNSVDSSRDAALADQFLGVLGVVRGGGGVGKRVLQLRADVTHTLASRVLGGHVVAGGENKEPVRVEGLLSGRVVKVALNAIDQGIDPIKEEARELLLDRGIQACGHGEGCGGGCDGGVRVLAVIIDVILRLLMWWGVDALLLLSLAWLRGVQKRRSVQRRRSVQKRR